MALEASTQSMVNKVFAELSKLTGHATWEDMVADGKKEVRNWKVIATPGTKASGNCTQFEFEFGLKENKQHQLMLQILFYFQIEIFLVI